MFKESNERWENMLESGEIHNRLVGWFSCDIEKHPEHLLEGLKGPNQVIVAIGLPLQKKLDFDPLQDEHWLIGEHYDVITKFVNAVWSFTGDFMTYVECEDILDHEWEGGKTYWDAIYFGHQNSMDVMVENHAGEPRQQYAELIYAAMVERYEYYHEMHTAFHFNNDPECAMKFGISPANPDLMMLIREKSFRDTPYLLTGHEAPFSVETILEWINVSIVRSLPRWSKRAHSSIIEGHSNGIILIMPDLSDEKAVKADERYKAFLDIVKLTQTYDSGTFGDMIPILESEIPEYEIEGLPHLERFLKMTYFIKTKDPLEVDYPQFFMLHGRTKEIIPCPYKWTPDWTPNSEFILLWAIEEALRLDREMSNEMLVHFQSEEFQQDESIPEEEKQELMHAWS